MKTRILFYPLMTEKAVRMLDAENKITFVVKTKSSKEEIKKECQERFNVKVDSVNTQMIKNKKVAFVRLAKESKAIDVITKLGLM